MRPPLKLSAIDQEHLQELYDQTGVARDELPYTDAFDQICQGFQDRTFKNAHPEQVFAALCKHVRSSRHAPKEAVLVSLTEEQVAQLKAILPRHAKGGKILPYGEEFEAANKEFNKLSGATLEASNFWRAITRAVSARRRPPVRRKTVAVAAGEDESSEAGE
jgi:hypothetical protein